MPKLFALAIYRGHLLPVPPATDCALNAHSYTTASQVQQRKEYVLWNQFHHGRE
jgi:hypothetical protein